MAELADKIEAVRADNQLGALDWDAQAARFVDLIRDQRLSAFDAAALLANKFRLIVLLGATEELDKIIVNLGVTLAAPPRVAQ